MGTNFYFLTKNKEMALKYAPYDYSFTDVPDWGYKIHAGKTSCGWLPLMQAHKDGICSVKGYKEAYDTGEFKICDEYETEYTWEKFVSRVLEHNGGVDGVMQKKPIETSGDSDLPDYIPVSHFDYSKSGFAVNYYKDSDGYEFTFCEFS